MKTKITDELIKRCLNCVDALTTKDCSECACNERECIELLLEIKNISDSKGE